MNRRQGDNGWPRSERLERAVLAALHDPSIMLNRTLGLGLQRPATAATIDAIRACYRAAAIDRFFLHLHPRARPDSPSALLESAGPRSHRRWMKFERDTEPPPAAGSDLRVRAVDAAGAADFGRIVAPAFDLAPAAADLFPGLVGRPGFHLYTSFDGDTPAGTGLLYLDGRDVWLDWGATDPALRGRGSQRALLARRIADAIAAGCSRLHTCTGEAVPGDPQHSYHNIEWAGFRPHLLRENWVPA